MPLNGALIDWSNDLNRNPDSKLKLPIASDKAETIGVLSLVAVLLTPIAAPGGEKIDYSESKRPIEAPKSGGQDKGGPSFREMLTRNPGGNSLSPEFETPVPSAPVQLTPADKKKITEYLDKKKNWIFNSSAKDDKEPNISEMFGVREASFDGSGKPKSSMERFFEDRPDRKKQAGDRPSSRDNPFGINDRSRNDENTMAGSLEPDVPAPGGAISELNVNNFLHPDLGPANRDSATSDLSRNRLDPGHFSNPKPDSAKELERVKEIDIHAQDFQKLLQPAGTSRSMALDPLNSQPDSTRQEINPIMSRQIEALRSPSPESMEVKSPGSSFGPPTSGALDALNNHMSSGSSLIPSLSAPQPTFHIDVKPIILEIPKRKI